MEKWATGEIESSTQIEHRLDLLRQQRDAIDQRQHSGYGDAVRHLRVSGEIESLEIELSRLRQKASVGQG